jgi:hypothetical protein
MNAMYLSELADKTRRGLRGRIEIGRAGGGLCYGYRVLRRIENGAVTTGEREIVDEEAAVIRRIFRDYAAGASPKQICKALNKEAVPGPQGALWGPSTIHGNPKRGIGILHNELYVGRMVWNRQRFLKDPDSGKRVARPNPESAWIIKDVPALASLTTRHGRLFAIDTRQCSGSGPQRRRRASINSGDRSICCSPA